MFMQSIRHATKKHRKVLLAVVILLLLGLVGSFATWNAANRGNIGSAGSGAGATQDQQLANYQDYIASLHTQYGDSPDYSGSLTMASAYLQLSSLNLDKYNGEMAKIPAVDPPKQDANGNAVPLSADEQATQDAKQKAHDDAVAAAQTWQQASQDAAVQAENFYQRASDNAPEGLNDAGFAEIKAGMAQARDMKGDEQGALGFMEDAYKLAPDNINYLLALAQLRQNTNDLQGALTLYEQASASYPDSASLISSQASLQAQLGNNDKALELYKQARTMAPADYNIAYSYATFLLLSQSTQAGLDELTAYRDALPKGDPNIAKANDGLTNLQGWADLFASAAKGSDQSDSTANGTDSGTGNSTDSGSDSGAASGAEGSQGSSN